MTYTHLNNAVEQKEASQKAERVTAICQELSIKLDPINWQQFGMRAPVTINNVEIASLMDLRERDSDDILRRVQMKMFEQAALRCAHAQPGLKALMWSPVDVIRPQPFLNLWVITLETDIRVPIVETMQDNQRVYEYYQFRSGDMEQLSSLFGPAVKGEYNNGDEITVKERDKQFTGKIIYIITPGKSTSTRKHGSKGYHTIAGTTYTSDNAPRYIIDCNDGFPHIINQSQIVQ